MRRKKSKENPRSKPHPAQGSHRLSEKQPKEQLQPEEQLGLSRAWLATAGGLLLVSLCWSYWPSLLETFAAWVKEPDYSHGFLVAPLAVLFLYLRREELPLAAVRPSAVGLILLLACLALRYAAGIYFLQRPVDDSALDNWVCLDLVWLGLFAMGSAKHRVFVVYVSATLYGRKFAERPTAIVGNSAEQRLALDFGSAGFG